MNLVDAYAIGSYTEYLAVLASMTKVHGEHGLIWALREVKRTLDEQKLLTSFVDEVSNWIAELEKYPKGEFLKPEDVKALEAASANWRSVIRKELEGIPVVKIELQSGLNPDELRKVANKSPSEFISEKTWKNLTSIEKSDFSDAAKCLLLGTATPSVMVALRGAEACVRNFYRCKTGNEPGKKTWRQLTGELKGQAGTLGIKDTFIGYLDYIGEAKRNFAQHPNKVYSLTEAVIVFMQVVGVVEDVYEQLRCS